MCGRVNALRHAGHDQRAAANHLIAQLLGAVDAVGRGGTGAHHRHGGLLVKKWHGTAAIEQNRRVKNIPQSDGIGRVVHGQDKQLLFGAVRQNGLGALQRAVRQALRLFPAQSGGHSLLHVCVVYVLR